jgi:hypothetical protein
VDRHCAHQRPACRLDRSALTPLGQVSNYGIELWSGSRRTVDWHAGDHEQTVLGMSMVMEEADRDRPVEGE